MTAFSDRNLNLTFAELLGETTGLKSRVCGKIVLASHLDHLKFEPWKLSAPDETSETKLNLQPSKNFARLENHFIIGVGSSRRKTDVVVVSDATSNVTLLRQKWRSAVIETWRNRYFYSGPKPWLSGCVEGETISWRSNWVEQETQLFSIIFASSVMSW